MFGRRALLCPHRYQQGVIREPLADAGVDQTVRDVQTGQSITYPVGAGVGRDLCQVIPIGTAESKRLSQRQRPVHQVWVRRHELDLYAVAGEAVQPQKTFDRRNTATTDDSAEVVHS
jgi:hypothetical protein